MFWIVKWWIKPISKNWKKENRHCKSVKCVLSLDLFKCHLWALLHDVKSLSIYKIYIIFLKLSPTFKDSSLFILIIFLKENNSVISSNIRNYLTSVNFFFLCQFIFIRLFIISSLIELAIAFKSEHFNSIAQTKLVLCHAISAICKSHSCICT